MHVSAFFGNTASDQSTVPEVPRVITCRGDFMTEMAVTLLEMECDQQTRIFLLPVVSDLFMTSQAMLDKSREAFSKEYNAMYKALSVRFLPEECEDLVLPDNCEKLVQHRIISSAEACLIAKYKLFDAKYHAIHAIRNIRWSAITKLFGETREKIKFIEAQDQSRMDEFEKYMTLKRVRAADLARDKNERKKHLRRIFLAGRRVTFSL